MNSIIFSKKVLVLVLFLIVIIFIVLFSFSNKPPTPQAPQVNKTYDSEVLNKDFDRINNPNALSASDEAVKSKLLKIVNNQSGNLKRTDTYSIDYVAGVKEFMVKIDTLEADKAKIDSAQWFKDQGLSQQGICNLPVVYFLGGATLSTFREQNKKFNPIPDGC